MNNKLPVVIIVVAVVGLLSFLVMVINDFNDASVIRSNAKWTEKDSVMMAKMDSLHVRDSILGVMIMDQEKKIESMGNSIVNINRNINTLGNIINEN
jgi:NADH:ubiquinone oxidoreductase subunit 6 (subunit J)